MGTCLLALALACATPPPVPVPGAVPGAGAATPASAPAADPWLGQDKARHFGMSVAATLFAYAGARAFMDAEPAARAGAGTALALGVGKELHDRRAGGRFSLRDMAWNAAGVALGFTIAQRIR